MVKADGHKQALEERLGQLRANYKECQTKMRRYVTEASDLKKEIEAYDPKTISNTEGVGFQIGKLLFECSRQFNVRSNLDEKQIDYLVASIIQEYPNFRLEEIAFVLRKGILGNYGKNEFKLDAQNIHGWITAYKDKKDEYYNQKRVAIEENEKRNSYI